MLLQTTPNNINNRLKHVYRTIYLEYAPTIKARAYSILHLLEEQGPTQDLMQSFESLARQVWYINHDFDHLIPFDDEWDNYERWKNSVGN